MEQVFTPPVEFPAKYVSRIGIDVYLLGRAENGRLVGYFQFLDGDISSGDWSDGGRFDKHNDEDSCNDLFDNFVTPVPAYQPGDVF